MSTTTTGRYSPVPSVPDRATAPSAIRTTSMRRRRQARAGIGFVTPFMAMFTLVFLIPIVVSVYRSFFRDVASGSDLYGGGDKVSSFVGLDNYAQAAGQPAFWRGMGRVLLFGVVQVPVMILAALALALVLDSLLVKRVTVFRLGFFLPYAIPGIVAAIVWLYMYNPSFSPLNELLGLIGLNVDFFGRNIILWSMANITTWTFTGYNMLIFLAALQAVPHELYEAARIDGATGWQIVRHIKIPMVRSASLLAVLLSIIGTVQLFNEPTVLYSQNQWMGLDYTPMMMAYNSMTGALSPSGSGPASAISVLIALVAGVLAALYALVQNRIDK